MQLLILLLNFQHIVAGVGDGGDVVTAGT